MFLYCFRNHVVSMFGAKTCTMNASEFIYSLLINVFLQVRDCC